MSDSRKALRVGEISKYTTMKTKELIRFIEEPEELNDFDMNNIRGGSLGIDHNCANFQCGTYTVGKSN
jgi:hypothetical protein